jgi:hypothetical protein
MSYIGNTPTTQSFISGTDYFNGTGSQTAFTLSRTVASVNDIQAVVNNVVQVPNDAYTISGTTITFTSAPSSGTQNVYVRYLSTTTQAITPSQNTVSYSTLNSDNQSKLGISYKNRIINGNMTIDQRNAGASVTVNGAAPYTLDRWRAQDLTDGVFTVQQDAGAVTPPAGFTDYLGVTTTTADSSLGASQVARVFQSIEGFNIADLGWGTANAKTVTVSFWVRSSLTGSFGGSLLNGSDNRAYPFSYTINAANTWEQKSVTIPGDTSGTWNTTNSTGIVLIFGLGVGSIFSGTANAWASSELYAPTGSVSVIGTLNATWYITGVQLEVGTQATTFTTAGGSYGAELALCQRYFNRMNLVNFTGIVGWADTTTDFITMISFPVVMRDSPTFTSSGAGSVLIVRKAGAPAAINTTDIYQTAGGTQNARIYASVSGGLTAGTGGAIAAGESQTGFMAWSAEL